VSHRPANAHAEAARSTARLIVNADDFGYFDSVSKGILDCARAGVVTATGIMANGPAFDRCVGKLGEIPTLSAGVHLNATLGRPLTDAMRNELPSGHGEFPSKLELAGWLLRGRVTVATLLEEWRAQIRRCLDAGLELHFLNSHEHVHILPPLYRGIFELAREFGIAHVRVPRPEWGPSWTAGGVFRSGVFAAVRLILPPSPAQAPVFIGLDSSGKLDMRYCRRRFGKLRAGTTYELMCHPGWKDPVALEDPKLAAYHDWELELRTLTSPEFAALLREHGIALVSYANLPAPS
jgi:hypothetical protein